MTSAALELRDVEPAAQPLDRPGSGRARGWRGRAEWAAFGLAFLVWWLYVLPARGGWERHVVPVACLLLLPSLLVLRPWRRLSPWIVGVASAPAVGALAVAAWAPYGDGGPISLSRWGYFGGILLVTAAFARTGARRSAVLVAVLLAGLHQYSQAWLPWWGGGSSVGDPMLGTIYSANPFGGLMLGFALTAATLAVLGDGPLRRLGLLVAPLAATAVVLSGARAAVLLLGLGVGVLAVLGLVHRGPRGLLRCGVVAAVCWATLGLSTSSLFFGEQQNALTATTSKSESGQTLGSTTGVRLDFWRAAVGQLYEHPVLGGGSGSYAGDSRLRMSPAAELSPFAHNEMLGSLAEGGLVLGLPVLALLAAGSWLCAWTLLTSRRRARAGGSEAAVGAAAALAAGAVLAHSLVDFALSFPAILALVGLLLGVCVAGLPRAAPPAGRPVALAATLAVAAVAGCGGYLGVSHDRAGVSSRVAIPADGALPQPLPGVRDGRVVIAQARALLRATGSSPVDLRRREAALRPLARHDAQVEALRLDLLDRLGRRAEARSAARELAVRGRERSPLLLLPYASRLEPREGVDLLLAEAYLRADEPGRVQGQLVDLLREAHQRRPRQEPGWSCAVAALQRQGARADDLGVAFRPDRAISTAQCTSWAAAAADLLGDPL